MSKSKYILLLFSVVTQALLSQTFYREYGGASTNEGGQSIIGSPDGNILVGGYKADSALVMKLDPLGNILWSICFKPSPNDNLISGINITPDNFIVGTGNGLPSGQGIRDGFYFKMDLSGNLLWVRKINDTRPVYCKTILPTSTTQYILYADIYDVSSSTWADVFSARIDASNGNMNWMSARLDYIPTNSYIDDIGAAVTGKGNSMYSTGRIYVNGSSPSGMRVFQSKFDNAGNHLFSQFLVHTQSDNARLYGMDIIYDNDSLIHCYTGDKNGASSNFTAGLIKADTLGNVIWSKDYNIISSSLEFSQKVLKTNFGYAIYGYMAGTTKDLFIIATDHNGNVIWHKSYGTNTSDEDIRQAFSPCAAFINGHLYFTGRKVSGGDQNIIIGRTDQTGTIPCTSVNNLTVTQTNNPTATTNCPMNFPSDALSIPLVSGSSLNTVIPDACSTYSVNLGKDTSFCGSFNLSLNASIAGATQYAWQNGATTSSINASSPGTYWVNVQIGNCCTISDTIVISTSNTLAISSSNLVICSGGLATLSAAGGATYLWNTGATTSSIIVSPSTTSSYSVTASTGTCIGTATATVTVNPVPVATITGNTTICTGDMTTLTASGGANYLWNNGTTTSVITVAPNTTTSYIAVVFSGSCSDTATITVTSNPLPTITALGNTTICFGDTTQLQCTGTASIYSWAPSTSISPSIGTLVSAFPVISTTYTVTGADINGCINTGTVSVFVNQLPSIVISGNTSICNGNTTTLTASGGTNYNWSNGSTSSVIVVSPGVTSTYSVIVSNNSCPGLAYTTVTVTAPPIAAVSNTTICLGASAILTASGGTNYSWNNGSTNSTIQISPSTTTSYSVIVSIATCSDTASGIVTVNPIPTITAGGSTSIAQGSAATLTASGSNTYLWNTGETTSSISVSPSITTTYTVITSDINGCTAIDSVTVFISEDDCSTFLKTFFIPNVFSPNDDGENDLLYLFYNSKTSCIKDFKISIYNRWGEKIYETTNISDAWDGTYRGQKMNPAVFFYYCRISTITGVEMLTKGNISLLR